MCNILEATEEAANRESEHLDWLIATCNPYPKEPVSCVEFLKSEIQKLEHAQIYQTIFMHVKEVKSIILNDSARLDQQN